MASGTDPHLGFPDIQGSMCAAAMECVPSRAVIGVAPKLSGTSLPPKTYAGQAAGYRRTLRIPTPVKSTIAYRTQSTQSWRVRSHTRIWFLGCVDQFEHAKHGTVARTCYLPLSPHSFQSNQISTSAVSNSFTSIPFRTTVPGVLVRDIVTGSSSLSSPSSPAIKTKAAILSSFLAQYNLHAR